MGLSKTQMDDLVEKVQYFLDNPVHRIDEEKNSIVDWFKENPIEKDYYWK